MNYQEACKKFYKKHVGSKLPGNWQATAFLRGIGFLKIPLLFSVHPTVVQLSNSRAEVKIPLRRHTKNHLGSMYFGALAIGADSVVGVLAMYHIEKSESPIQLVFKDFHVDFLKRPTSDVHFICEDGKNISQLVEKVARSGERMNLSVPGYAIVPKISSEPVAKFTLTLSLKRKSDV